MCIYICTHTHTHIYIYMAMRPICSPKRIIGIAQTFETHRHCTH